MGDLFYPINAYEKARILGTRATQLEKGAVPKVDTTGLIDPLKIAEKEYMAGTIPLCIVRTLPNGSKIKIKIKPKKL